MLTVQELRIGNWVNRGDRYSSRPQSRYFKIDRLDDGWGISPNISDGCMEEDDGVYSGIPLTAELLIKCGFRPNENDTWLELAIGDNVDGQQQHLSATRMTPKDVCAVVLLNGYNEQGMDAFDVAEAFADFKREDHPHGISYIEKSGTISIRHCEYLHQLQNLVFCLTGKEINIDL